ncbi:hypothetical protein GOBAR_AA30989 [Gossypium barbadense]|uniref:DUF4283 domain-containing protein n=1 Tax=Gossypium barbadense TaxID=3634 RepID=A0A2P5WF69_GOSBA|nr:hypothetical protein GOBAR_AA30989 [Gossypium barbadense]
MIDINTVDEGLANLNIMNEEEDPMVLLGDDIAIDNLYELCLVGRVLTDSVGNFPSLKNTLADLWHPLRGVTITEMEDKRIFFKFYSEIDLERVMDVDFGWDLSLKVAPRRGGQLMSKWLRKELETNMWINMKIDGEIRERKFGMDSEQLEEKGEEFVDGKKRQRFNPEVGNS